MALEKKAGDRFKKAFTDLVRNTLTKPRDFKMVSFRTYATKHGVSSNFKQRLMQLGLVEETTTTLGTRNVPIYAATDLAFLVLASNFDWNRFPVAKITQHHLLIASRAPMYGTAILNIMEQVKSAYQYSVINEKQIAYSNNVALAPLLTMLHAARAIDWMRCEDGVIMARRTYLTDYLDAFDWSTVTGAMDIQPSVLHDTLREALYKARPELSRSNEPVPTTDLDQMSDEQLFGKPKPSDLHDIITSNDLSVAPPDDEDEIATLTRELVFAEEESAKVRSKLNAAIKQREVIAQQNKEKAVRDALEGFKLEDVQDVLNKLRKEKVVVI